MQEQGKQPILIGDRIVGIGAALVDILINAEDDFVIQSGAAKGGMLYVDRDVIDQTVKRSGTKPVMVSGGSACNTIVGIGKLGAPARFVGKRGDDELGTFLEDSLISNQVEPNFLTCKSPTGCVLSIITPDAERSMLTFLGATGEETPDEMTSQRFEGAAIVHIEGYRLFSHDLILAGIEAAKSTGALISLDLASYTVVNAARDYLASLVESYVDILIANEDEARAFTGLDNENQALEVMAGKADIAVLKIGARGSLVAHKGRVIQVAPCGNGDIVDTTGAGDLWAAGFLYGLFYGFPLEKCGELASACGYEVCRVMGAHIGEEGWSRVRALLPA